MEGLAGDFSSTADKHTQVWIWARLLGHCQSYSLWKWCPPEITQKTQDCRSPPCHELFPQYGENEILAATGCQAHPQPYNLLADIFICIILPPRLNSFFDEVEVLCPARFQGGTGGSRLFHGGKGANLFDILHIALWADGNSVEWQRVLLYCREHSAGPGTIAFLSLLLRILSHCLFFPTIFLCLVFFILIMIPTVIIVHGLELLTAAVTTALPNESTTSHVIIFRASFEGVWTMQQIPVPGLMLCCHLEILNNILNRVTHLFILRWTPQIM